MTDTDTAHVEIPAPRKPTGRPPMTSRAALIAAARGIGFRDLTIGAVTEACGVKYSTAYRHVSGVDELTAALVDDILGEVRQPDHPDWRTQFDDVATLLRGVLVAWPGMAAAIAGLDERPAWLAAARDRCADRMLTAGFPAGQVDALVCDALTIAAMDPAAVSPGAVGVQLDGIAARGWGA